MAGFFVVVDTHLLISLSVLVGVIGGSGLYHLDNLTFVYVNLSILSHTILSHSFNRKTVNPLTVE